MRDKKIRWFLKELNIEHHFASLSHAQTNGQVEVENKVVMDGLIKMVNALRGKWAGELKNVLWVVRSTLNKLTGETLFTLVLWI